LFGVTSLEMMQMRLEVDDGEIRNARGTDAYTRIGGR